MKNYKELISYNGEFYGEDVFGSNIATYATLWFKDNVLMYVEPYAEYNDGSRHYYNRISPYELDTFNNIRYYVN